MCVRINSRHFFSSLNNLNDHRVTSNLVCCAGAVYQRVHRATVFRGAWERVKFFVNTAAEVAGKMEGERCDNRLWLNAPILRERKRRSRIYHREENGGLLVM